MKFIITESQYKILLENIPAIDDILDKMSKVGYENLNSQEKSTLNKYSEHLKSGQRGEFVTDEPNDNQEIDDKSGETWETELADESIFSFQFDYDEEDMGVKMLFGTVMWDNREWIGCIVVDEDNTLGMLDFVEDTGDFLTYDANDPSSKPEGDEGAFLSDELGQLIDEVEYFVEEKIIPDLI
jgi:hypothetical protein